MSTQDKSGTSNRLECAGDVDCGCRLRLIELEAERERNGWRPEWFGLPPKPEVLDAPELSVCGAVL